MPRWLVPMIIVCTLGLALSLAALLMLGRQWEPAGAGAPDPWVQDYGVEGLLVPGFQLVNQHAQPVDESMLRGRVSIVDFIFTHCPFVCPGMALAMGDLNTSLADTGVQFVSMSVDPVHDTPARLTEYARSLNADTARWHFLTGVPGAVRAIVHDGLGFALQDDDATRIGLPGGGEMGNIVHPSRLVLVGPDLKVLGMYAYEDEDAVAALAARARRLDFELRKRTPSAGP